MSWYPFSQSEETYCGLIICTELINSALGLWRTADRYAPLCRWSVGCSWWRPRRRCGWTPRGIWCQQTSQKLSEGSERRTIMCSVFCKGKTLQCYINALTYRKFNSVSVWMKCLYATVLETSDDEKQTLWNCNKHHKSSQSLHWCNAVYLCHVEDGRTLHSMHHLIFLIVGFSCSYSSKYEIHVL